MTSKWKRVWRDPDIYLNRETGMVAVFYNDGTLEIGILSKEALSYLRGGIYANN